MKYKGTRSMLLLKPVLGDKQSELIAYDLLHKMHQDVEMETMVHDVLELVLAHMHNSAFEAKVAAIRALTYQQNHVFETYLEELYKYFEECNEVSSETALFMIAGVSEYATEEMEFDERPRNRKHLYTFFVRMILLVHSNHRIRQDLREKIPEVISSFVASVHSEKEVRKVARELMDGIDVSDFEGWLRVVHGSDDNFFLPIVLNELTSQLFSKLSNADAIAALAHRKVPKPNLKAVQ